MMWWFVLGIWIMTLIPDITINFMIQFSVSFILVVIAIPVIYKLTSYIKNSIKNPEKFKKDLYGIYLRMSTIQKIITCQYFVCGFIKYNAKRHYMLDGKKCDIDNLLDRIDDVLMEEAMMEQTVISARDLIEKANNAPADETM